MKKIVYPVFRNCEPLTKAITLTDGGHSLEIDLKNAFHWGYIDRHGKAPLNGKNPFLSEYEDLIDACDDLRFIAPGIASDDEGKKGESNKLGRSFALGLLNEHFGYMWFPSIANLRRKPENGWSAHRKNKGNSPDWLAGNSNSEFAVVEAKGTHSKIAPDNAKADEWRQQVQNIIIKHHGREMSLKTWIIATRFVTTDSADLPEMLIEDPPLEGLPLNQDNSVSLGQWISKSHVVQNLSRINHYDLILRINEPSVKVSRTLIWQCVHPSLEQYRFIGNPTSINQFYNLPFYVWEDFLFHSSERRLERMQFWFQNFFHQGFFDGIELGVVRDVIDNRIPKIIDTRELGLDQYDFISLLNDGSFIAPMSLMRLVDIKEL